MRKTCQQEMVTDGLTQSVKHKCKTNSRKAESKSQPPPMSALRNHSELHAKVFVCIPREPLGVWSHSWYLTHNELDQRHFFQKIITTGRCKASFPTDLLVRQMMGFLHSHRTWAYATDTLGTIHTVCDTSTSENLPLEGAASWIHSSHCDPELSDS